MQSETRPTLLIMAAGLGSRFGGVKQLARVGPNDEAFLDFSIKDAQAAGFGTVVLIVRTEIEADVRAHIAEQHPDLDAVYVRQDDLGPPRDKPWGTLHAVLSAAEAIDAPFAAINADDYYGPSTFALAAEQLAAIAPGTAANVAFKIGNTVPPAGSVSRALCEVADGLLTSIVELEECERLDDGQLLAGGNPVDEDSPVSMNLWCFDRTILDTFEQRWQAFHAANADEPKAECQLPTVVGELIDEGLLSVNIVSSSEQWIGITNPEDHELARAALAHR